MTNRISQKSAEGPAASRLEWCEAGLDIPPSVSHEGLGHDLLLRSLRSDLGAETNIEVNAGGMRFFTNLPLGPDILAEASE